VFAKRVTRRQMLRFAGFAAGTAALAACGATPTAAPAATSAPEATAVPPTATSAPPTPDTSGTAMAESKSATEQAIAVEARATEDVFKLTAEEFTARMEEDLKKAESEGKTVIEMMSAYGTIVDDNTQPMYWILRGFMEKNPDIYVKYTPSSAYAGAFNEAILMRMASGDPPDCILHYSAPIAYAARGTCQQLDDLMDAHPVGNKEAWPASVLAQTQWNGKTWGVPVNGSQDAMWYNLDAMEKAGLGTTRDAFPKTLDELQEWTATVNKWDGNTMTEIGYTPWDDNWSWYGKMVANGGSLWDGEKYSINAEKNVELAEYWIAWIEKHFKGDIDALASQTDLNNPYPESGFGLGIQTICDAGVWSMTHVPLDIRWEIDVMPTGPSGSENATSNWPNLMFIPVGAKHLKEGFELCVFTATEGQVEWWNRWSDVPYWTKFPGDVAPEDLIARVGQEKALELTKFTRDYANQIVVQWNSPIDDLANDEIFRAVDGALHKQIGVQESLDACQELVTAKLQEVVAGA